MPTVEISFRPVTHDDLALMDKWMRQSHWQDWWGAPEREIGYIIDMLDGRDTTRPFIFQADGADCGYIQYWSVRDQIDGGWIDKDPWLALVDPEYVGVDLSIGPAPCLSRRLGSAALAAFCALLRDNGHTNILIDPDIGNTRAIRAYEKAGFRVIDALSGKTGKTYLMSYCGSPHVDD